MFESHLVETGVLNDDLYKLNLNECVSFQIEFDNNSSMFSYVLWHKKLGNISQEMMNTLVQANILPSLPDNYGSYVECIREKLTKTKRRGSNRSSNLLETIHTNICGLFSLNGLKYFISLLVTYAMAIFF